MTFLSPAAKVSADSKAYRLEIDADPRFAAAAGGVARFVAEAAGLSSEAAGDLQKSVVMICVEAFENLGSGHSHLTVTVEQFPDRIEVAVAQEGAASPALGLERIAGFSPQPGSATPLRGIDRIQFEMRAGTAITRLGKYLGGAPPAG